MSPLFYGPDGEPVELARGRGDLRYSSAPSSLWDNARALTLVDGKTTSYARLFATQVWVAAAVMRMLSWSIRVPLKVYRRTGEDSRVRLRPREHPLAAAIVEPWVGASQAQLVMALLGPLLVHGNGVTNVEQGRSNKIRFEPFDWRCTVPIRAFNRIAGWKLVDGGAETREVGADTAMHLAWWSPLDPLGVGVSPLQQLGVTLSIEDAAQRYQQGLFRNGARPPSAIQAAKEFLTELDKGERQVFMENLRKDVDSIYGGPDNAGKPALLPPGLEWNTVGHTAVEAELIDQRKVAREETAAVYQIPPPMLGILDRATFSNITTLREVAYTDSLGPPLVLTEQMINAHVVRGLLRENDIYVEFDFGHVLRGDRLKEIKALREGVSMGIYTPNEARRALNQPASKAPAADHLYLPKNNLESIGALDGTAAPADPDDDDDGAEAGASQEPTHVEA